MSCPHCDADAIAFAVPPTLREHAPADAAAICTRCLRVVAAAEAGVEGAAAEAEIADGVPADPDFSAVDPAFPSGEAGVALALCCGKLESFALNRASIEALIGHAEGAGADAFAFFDRLDAPEAAFDLDRRRAALRDAI
ncbi:MULTISPECIES: DUF6276 family protein [Halorubrum]|uniref:Uncharacterized protein n=1 Tax=Halorubrum sodomense TaxID=35743 RepID=A0A1I6FV78_HALSD|nr:MULTISPECIES: DUF6276 family protein [Halorubrum]TKX53466.1 hypothetical protein EXE42_12540 [Halorubrum sp. SP3]TKX69571.1 hypothetical protein EXE45_08035 [Halorubrum sp. SP9]SFR33833.1 hypothetical protein SAMN04487937_1249 [Halorubrum sodomense]